MDTNGLAMSLTASVAAYYISVSGIMLVMRLLSRAGRVD